MILTATSSLVDDLLVASIAITIALGLVPSIICWLKGKRRWAIIGFFSAWHVVAAFRLAKPESWWARRFYDDGKLDESRARFASEGCVGPGSAAVSRDRLGPPTSPL